MKIHTINQHLLRGYFRLLQVWWFIRRPKTQGVKCLLEHDNTFLLVRLSYGHCQWSIPGGGVNSQESFETAAKREVLEETGITVTELRHIGNYAQTIGYKNDTVQCYHTVVPTRDFTIDNFEISEAQWFAIDELPPDHSPNVDRILNLYASQRN